MAEYPIPPKPAYKDFIVTPRWRTVISEMDAGNEQRKQKSTYAVYDVSLRYEHLTITEFQIIWNFYMARRGAYEAFHIYDLISMTHGETNMPIYVGLGDGTITTFDIPGKNTSLHSIYLNGYLVSDSNYTIITGGGDSNSDRVRFNVAPGMMETITCKFTGYLRIRCRFEEDRLSRESFEYLALRAGLKFRGLNPAED